MIAINLDKIWLNLKNNTIGVDKHCVVLRETNVSSRDGATAQKAEEQPSLNAARLLFPFQRVVQSRRHAL